MIGPVLLAAALQGVGLSCFGSDATTGAFIGLKNPLAHVARIDKVSLADPSFQGYAVAFLIASSSGKSYLTFRRYDQLAPAMLNGLSLLVGHRFKPYDSSFILRMNGTLRKTLHDGTFKIAPCVEWPPGKPFD